MTHTDASRFTQVADRGAAPDHNGGAVVIRTLLWLVLTISVVGNTVASSMGAGLGVHLVAGLVTAVCATLLVVRHLRSNR
ncbi:hypothetical protein [Streptomyces sp. NPDC058632]|uniref:hypothetical protein n=1 Tax=unclassified Streptomyces TaxID=2593676 RepID=UPI0036505215